MVSPLPPPSSTSPTPAPFQSPAATFSLTPTPGPTTTPPALTSSPKHADAAPVLELARASPRTPTPPSAPSPPSYAASLASPFIGLPGAPQGSLDEGGRSTPPHPSPAGHAAAAAPAAHAASAAPGMASPERPLSAAGSLPSSTAPSLSRSIHAASTHPEDPADGRVWQVQRSKRQRKKKTVPHLGSRSNGARSSGPGSGSRARVLPPAFKSELRGCCFRCLSPGHFAKLCRDPIRCLFCRRFGHTERHCRRRRSGLQAQAARSSSGSATPPPSQPPPPPPPALAMATRGGAAPLRMFESHSFVVATPPMENMVKALSTTALVGTLEEKRDVSPDAAARALERELGIPWANVVVTKHSPEDFLVRFDYPNHRRIAMEAGSLPCRGTTLSLKPWSPTARGIQRTWRFYCRLAIEGIPQQAWSVDAAQQVVAGKVIVDRLEQQSVERVNTSACFAWGWTWNPDVIPTSNTFSVIDRLDLTGRVVCAEGVPPVPERGGATYPVLIHLDTSKESAGPNGIVPPPVRHPWMLGVEDIRSQQPPRPRGGAHERLLPRRRDEDGDDAGAPRRPHGRRYFNGSLLGCDAPEGSASAPARRVRGQRGTGGGGGGRKRFDNGAAEAALAPADEVGHVGADEGASTGLPLTMHASDTELVIPPPLAELPWQLAPSPVSSQASLHFEVEPVVFGFDANSCWDALTRVDPMLLEATDPQHAPAVPALDACWPMLRTGSDSELHALALSRWSSLGLLGVGRADDVAFFEAVGAFGAAAPLPASVVGLPIIDDVAWQLQRLDLSGVGPLDKLFSVPCPAMLATPPTDVHVPNHGEDASPLPPTTVRRSARIEKLALGSSTAAERAQALLAKQLQFIDKVHDFSPKVRGRYVDRFKSPLGRKAVAKLARIVGIGSHASIALPDEDLQACLGVDGVGA
ncbi:hypothetical protein ACQ4PT_030590 [Festuca glaucescens]